MQVDDLSGLLLLRRFVEVAHHVPGRLRLRFTNALIAGLSKHKVSSLEKLCSADGCLRSCTLNSETNSLILEYQASQLDPVLLDTLFTGDESAAKQALEHIYQILSR